MPADMKEMIAEAARKLVVDQNVKKLTVKDIVEECHITRQAFYYHFEDIPALLQWILERDAAKLAQEVHAQADAEQGLRRFLQIAIHASPYIRRGMQSNYRDELERILTQSILDFFRQAVETDHLYPTCSRFEVDFIVKYHAQAILGLLRNWTEKDNEHLDQISHILYRIMLGEIPPAL